MNKLIKQMFLNRGINNPDSYMAEIDDDSHRQLLNVDRLAVSLYNIYLSHKHIVVLPDFDMDGIMSGVVGYAGLSVLGFKVSLFIPNPADGYGFTSKSIDRLLFDYPDVDAIITCDVGISCIEGISYAVSKGIDVLVTDHHTQTEDDKRDIEASVVVDPMSIDDEYEHPQICGAYVFYQCLYHLADKYFGPLERDYIYNLRVFAGIGTISDSMPLLYENRQLVRDAVSIMRLLYIDKAVFISDMRFVNDVYKHAFLGLYACIDIFCEMGTIHDVSDIDETFFGFYLAPMFNSVKRLNGDMSKAFLVFFGYNRQSCVEYLYELNAKRKALVSTELQTIIDSDQPYAPYIYISNASSGVLGLLATSLLNLNGVPTAVVRRDGDGYKGSARSVPWFPFFSKLRQQGFFAAGHELAFGMGVSSPSELSRLYDYLDSEVKKIMNENPSLVCGTVVPDFVIDLSCNGDTDIDLDLFREYMHELKFYRPFGPGFPEPLIELKFKAYEGQWFVMGSMKQHLRVTLLCGFPVLCFNQGDYISYADKDALITVHGHIAYNRYNGVVSLNFIGNIEQVEVLSDD